MFERHRDLEDPTDGPDVLSAIEVSEKGKAPLVGTGSMVGLRSDEAEDMAAKWLKRSINNTINAASHRKAGRTEAALVCETWSAAYLLCADELRQHAGLPIPRQPEPNTPVSQPVEHHSRKESK